MGKRWLVVLICVMGLSITRRADAQVSVWLQDGTSGFGARTGIGVDDSSTSFNVEGGYSHLGVLDVVVGLTYVMYKNDNAIAPDLGAYGGLVGLQYHPLKQRAEMPISLGLGVAVPAIKLTSQRLDDAGVSASAVGVGAGIEAYRFIKLAPDIGVTPSVALAYTYRHTSVSNMSGDSVTNDDNHFGVSLTSYFGFLGANGTIYGVAPSLQIGDPISFTLYVGMIWPMHKDH